MTRVLYPDTAVDYLSPQSGRRRGPHFEGVEGLRVSSPVTDEGEHPEGEDDLDAKGRGVWGLNFGKPVKGEDGAGGDEDDDAGDDDGAELDAEGDRERAGNVGDARKGGDEDDEVEEAAADPRRRGQHVEP